MSFRAMFFTLESRLTVVERFSGVLSHVRKHFVMFPQHICIGKPGKPVHKSHQYSGKSPLRQLGHTILSCFTRILLLNGSDFCNRVLMVVPDRSIGTFRSEDEDNYEYEFSVLSTRTSKDVGLQTLCACSV